MRSGNRMLLVVVGAGASHDCMVNEEPNQWKPPLTKDVFDLTRAGYGAFALKYPAAASVIDEVATELADRGDATTLERELAKLVTEADTWPDRKAGLLSVQFYLSDLFEQVSRAMASVKGSITNYSRLLTPLERWRNRTEGAITYVTFNYDTMLDEALRQYERLVTLDDYVRPHRNYFKVHGSVDWSRHVLIDGVDAPASKDELIYGASRLNYTDEWWIRPTASTIHHHNGTWVPAIAIPMEDKDESLLPTDHYHALKAVLPQVTHVLLIGWRAREKQFLELLRTVPANVPMTVVTHTEQGTLEVAAQLRNEARLVGPTERFAGGFRTFVRGEALIQFIGRLQ
jgi:hypothetical protein